MQQDEENSLVDLLLVAAENIRLLVIGPLLVAAIAFGLMYMKPRTYVSQAILLLPMPVPTNVPTRVRTPTPTQVVTILTSPKVLDPVVESMGLGRGGGLEAARKALAERVKATVGKDEFLRMDVAGNTPQEALATANALIDGLLKSTVPGEGDRQILEERHATVQIGLNAVNAMLKRLEVGEAVLQGPRASGNEGVVAAGELQFRYLTELLTSSRELKGMSRDVVVLAPTLPDTAAPQKKALTAVLSAVAAAFILLLFVSLRQSWRSSAADPGTARKQARLRKALGLKARLDACNDAQIES